MCLSCIGSWHKVRDIFIAEKSAKCSKADFIRIRPDILVVTGHDGIKKEKVI